jgi:endonuclease/exonuclease/phosphatase family metal-dependent hydrolase
MAVNITIATFNANNLFARFRFMGKKEKDGAVRQWTAAELEAIAKEGWLTDATFFELNNPEERKITADAIKATKADVVALQEIECLETLRRFNSQYLDSAYQYQLLIDSHDPRFIDVAVLSKKPFSLGHLRTHQFEKDGSSYVFSRDCLEVDIDLGGGKVLPLFVNHLKSMMEGRAQTAKKRLRQAEGIVRILKARFNLSRDKFVVLGDMNDYMDPADPSPALNTLVGDGKLINAVERLPVEERWTHFWNKDNNNAPEYRQLDYIFLSSALAKANPQALPKIERRGMPKRATRYDGPRFDGVGLDDPKASDHCPVSITITV